jgi:hypothetical protein
MGKRAAIFVVACIVLILVAVTMSVLVRQSNTPWVPYVSRSRVPPPVMARMQTTNGVLRVFPAGMGVLLILPDGSLWRWGQAGGFAFSRAMVPEQVGTNYDWLQACSANGQCVALRKDGTFWHWGSDYGAPLISSVPFTNLILSPEQVGAENDWASVTTGDQHSAALKKDGTVWAWGHDEHGQMGNGLGTKETNLLRLSRFYLHPIQTNLVQVSTNRDWIAIGCAQGSDTIGLRANGTLWVWGHVNRFWNGRPGAIFPVPTRVCRETNWLAIESDLALNRDGQVWMLFRAPPDASASAATTCLLLASNCIAGRFAFAQTGLYQLHADGSLWKAELTWHVGHDLHVTMGHKWHRVGKRSDWISLWGMGTAVGLTADGTVWIWGNDLGQEGQMPLSLKINLVEDKFKSWLGLAPSKSRSRWWMTPAQRTPRPLMRILPAEPAQPIAPKVPKTAAMNHETLDPGLARWRPFAMTSSCLARGPRA